MFYQKAKQKNQYNSKQTKNKTSTDEKWGTVSKKYKNTTDASS